MTQDEHSTPNQNRNWTWTLTRSWRCAECGARRYRDTGECANTDCPTHETDGDDTDTETEAPTNE